MALAALLTGSLLAGCQSASECQGQREAEECYRSAHFQKGRFRNSAVMPERGFAHFFPILIRHYLNGPEVVRVPARPPEIRPISVATLQRSPQSGLRIHWVGHATVLIELEGYRLLTDPIFSDRASPFDSVGPERYTPVPIRISDLPPLDVVLISHDHYDHLDRASIVKLKGKTKLFVVPLRVGKRLREMGVAGERIVELDWWQSRSFGKLRLTATPASHFSGRGLFDRNSTLWASWAIVGTRHRVYFSGDTGRFDGFKEIGDRLGPFDVTLLAIGAYSQHWRRIHLNPEDAIAAHRDLKGDLLIPIHWGTFNLAFHAWDEPAERFLSAASRLGIRFAIPRVGAAVENDTTRYAHPWWRGSKLPDRAAHRDSPQAGSNRVGEGPSIGIDIPALQNRGPLPGR